MKTTLINEICDLMREHLTDEQNQLLRSNLQKVFRQFNIPDDSGALSPQAQQTNMKLLNLFIAAKKIEGCSESTLSYYSSTLLKMINSIQKMYVKSKPMIFASTYIDIRIKGIPAK